LREIAVVAAAANRGKVFLVGAGPGDPDLLTVRAARLLAAADTILHDRMSRAAVRLHACPDALVLDVGKRKAAQPWSQTRITARLVEEALAGRMVVRLKGGDPGLFGRVSEELDALHAAGIEVEIVPGVSAGLAAAASAGISLTQRGVAQTVTFLTGHDETGALPAGIDWTAVASASHTIVLFMGLSSLHSLAVRLLGDGRSPTEPVLVVSRASMPDEVHLRTTLGSATLDIARANLPSPALVILGPVAQAARNGGPGATGSWRGVQRGRAPLLATGAEGPRPRHSAGAGAADGDKAGTRATASSKPATSA